MQRRLYINALTNRSASKKVFEELKTTLRDRYPECSEEALQALPINIFGFSQGGLVASIFAANYKDVLNIKTVILDHAPLSGTDLLENTRYHIEEFYQKAQLGLAAIGHSPTSLFEAKAISTALNTPGLKQFTNFLFKGIKDMRIDSKCIKRIIAFIRKGNHNIPILLEAVAIENHDSENRDIFFQYIAFLS